MDLVELLARIKGIEEEYISEEIARISQAVSGVISPSPPLIPFASRLITPTAFYERFPELFDLSVALLSPIVFADDIDAIGTGALNPIAAAIMGEQIYAAVTQRNSIRPFVTTVKLDYDGWAFLTRKHFGL